MYINLHFKFSNLWQIISSVQQHCPLSSLHGQTLDVDLRIWVVEGEGVRQMQGVVAKPCLRNLFFRISHLLQIGMHPLFVIEGNPTELRSNGKKTANKVPDQGEAGLTADGILIAA
ncbi:hypothetical protein FSP39_008195 [Pinctada imbricata]|uniref:XPG N-terminal domain-containing protein n=1 Tax=Pinctada imbricata TaxID=66713 RepID=A0AA88YB21_PINIB|nr:hypothetical protein FSP39_008195 [Pinctada imbricata]